MRFLAPIVLLCFSACNTQLPLTDQALSNEIGAVGSALVSNLNGTGSINSQQGAYLVAPVGSTSVVQFQGDYTLLQVLVTQTDGKTPAPGVVVWFQGAPGQINDPWGLGTASSNALGIASVQAAPRTTN